MIALIRKTVQSERTGHFNKTFRNNEIKSLISSRLVRISYSCKIRLKKILYVLCPQTLDKKKTYYNVNNCFISEGKFRFACKSKD